MRQRHERAVKQTILIAGPTASGKSVLALALAKQLKGVLINADASQVYTELRILSARPTPEEEAAAPHFLYGHVPAAERYSVAHWLKDARRAIEKTRGLGLMPILSAEPGSTSKRRSRGSRMCRRSPRMYVPRRMRFGKISGPKSSTNGWRATIRRRHFDGRRATAPLFACL